MGGISGLASKDKANLEREVKRRKLGRVAEFLAEEIRAMDIDDTGRLIRSIRVDVDRGTVVMKAPYGKFVDEGRRPGGKMPPYTSIRKWVGHKLGVTERKKARGVTWAIMQKIQKKGIPAKRVLEEAWSRARKA